MDMIRRTIDIYGREILLAFKDLLPDSACGRSHYTNGVIEIQIGEKEHEYRTVIHEMVHLAMVDNGMATLFDHEHTEAMCDFMQHFISQIYEPNREALLEIKSGRQLSKKKSRR